MYADEPLDPRGLAVAEEELKRRGLDTPVVISAVARFLLIPPSDHAVDALYDILQAHVEDPLGTYLRISNFEFDLRQSILLAYFNAAPDAPCIVDEEEGAVTEDEYMGEDGISALLEAMDELADAEIVQHQSCPVSEAARLRTIFQGINPPQFSDYILREKASDQDRIALLPKYEDNEGNNPVFGILSVPSKNVAYGLRSGTKQESSMHNNIFFQKGNVSNNMAESAGGIWETLYFHIEAQAAAFMRSQDITEAYLFMNVSTPCIGPTGCNNNLPVMLAEGTRLHVVNKVGKTTTYVGKKDE